MACLTRALASPVAAAGRDALAILPGKDYAEKMWQWQINHYENGRALREALGLRVPAAPPAYLRQLIRKGRVSIDGEVADEATRARDGMQVAIGDSSRLAALVRESALAPAEILYEDDHALVVFKAAGLVTHQHPEYADSLAGRVEHFTALRRAPYHPLPVHRLDLGTSGPVLFAKGRRAAGALGTRMMDHLVAKRYLALVRGEVPAHGELTSPVTDGGRQFASQTGYRRLASGDGLSLLELEPASGRRHQLRQQLADAGWPISGDSRYGGSALPGLGHLFLHCCELVFPRLDDDREVRIACPLPAELAAILAGHGLSLPVPS